MTRWFKSLALLLIFALFVQVWPAQVLASDPPQGTDEETVTEDSIRNNELVGPSTNYLVDQVDSFSTLFQNRNEVINPSSGALSLSFVDLVLPGRNGMDVEISRTYQSGQSNLYSPTTSVEYHDVPYHYPAGWYPNEAGHYVFPEVYEMHWHEPIYETHYSPPVYERRWQDPVYEWDYVEHCYDVHHPDEHIWHPPQDVWVPGYYWDHWHPPYTWDHWHEGYWWDHWHEGYWYLDSYTWNHWHDGYWYDHWYWNDWTEQWEKERRWSPGFWHTHYEEEWVWMPGYWHAHWEPGYWHTHHEPGYWHTHWEPGYWTTIPGYWEVIPGEIEEVCYEVALRRTISEGYWYDHLVQAGYYYDVLIQAGFWHKHVLQEAWEGWLNYGEVLLWYDDHIRYHTEWYQVNSRSSNTFLDRVNGIGQGWSFGFPVLERNGSQTYYHDGSGGTMLVDLNSPSGFKEYTSLDLTFAADNGTFTNGQTSSSYVVRRKDGHKTYFAQDGRLLGIQDRHGNTIRFEHTAVNGVQRISKIIDTLNREITFSYTTTQVTISAPGARTLTYNLTQAQGGKYLLSSALDPLGNATAYSYSIDNAAFSFFSKNYRDTNNVYANLTEVTYPGGGKAQYQYAKTTGNLGSGGSYEYYRITSRQDLVSGTAVGASTFTYQQSFDGYPTHWNPSSLPSGYTYGSTTTVPNGTQVQRVYNHEGLEVRNETSYPDGNSRIFEFTFDQWKNPATVTTTDRNAAGQTAVSTVSFTYDQHRNLLSTTDPQGATTTYTYESIFHQVTSVTQPQNAGDAAITTEFTINPSTGNIDAQRQVLTENGADQSIWTYFTYDSYGNQMEARLQMADGSFRTKTAEYSAAYGSAYVTQVTESYTTETGATGQSVSTYGYDPNTGLLTSFTDPMGATTTRVYDKLGRPTLLTHPTVGGVSATHTFSYDDSGLVNTFTDENGNVTQYHYDQVGRLIQVKRFLNGQLHTVRSLQFNGAGELVAETDANGNTTSYMYDGAGRKTRISHPDGSVETTVYDDANRRRDVTDANGNTVTFLLDVMGRTIEVQAKTDPNGATVYSTYASYDYAGNKRIETNARGHVTQFQYDALNRLVRTTDAGGNSYLLRYDNAGNVTSKTGPMGYETQYSYDLAGRMLTEINPLGGVTHYAYDAKGRRVSKTDANGNTTRYAFDARDRLVSITDPLGGVTSYTFDLAGNRLSATDPRGHTTSYAYDNWNRLIQVIDPLGGTKHVGYDLNGNQTSETNPLGHTTTFTYDARNRLISVINALGVTALTHQYDGAGNLTSETDANGGSVTYSYDGLNRKVSAMDPLGGTQVFHYDAAGNMIRLVDQNGHQTQFGYDALNRLVSVTEATGTTWTYTRDAYGNVTEVRDPAGQVTTQDAYDALNRKISFTNGLGIRTEYTYDAVGNLVAEQVVDGATTTGSRTFQYDALNRRTMITAAVLVIGYGYDAAGNRTSMTDGGGVTTFTYDALGRLLTRSVPDSKQIHYDYNLAGQLTKLTDYAGNVTTYTYDPTGRMLSASYGGAATTFAYDAAGNRTSVTRPNGVVTTYSYDLAGRLTNLTNQSGTTLSSYGYTYDAAHNITAVTEPTGTSTYTYDPLYRLVTANEPGHGITEFQYDVRGNRTQKLDASGTTRYQYDAANRLVQVQEPGGSRSFVWDASGNMLSDGTRSYTYDGLNRLSSLQAGTTTATYQYDGDGLLSHQTVDGQTTRFYLNGQHVINEGNGSGTITASMFQAGPSYLGRQVTGDPVAYFLFNGHGDVTGVADGAGGVLAGYEYDVFGQLRSSTGSFDNPFLYAGEYYDYTSELYYLRARHYSPQLGRFITQDTWKGTPWQPWTQNLYVYVGNNPINYVDPTGHFAAPAQAPDVSQFLSQLKPQQPLPPHNTTSGGLLRYLKWANVPLAVMMDVLLNQGEAGETATDLTPAQLAYRKMLVSENHGGHALSKHGFVSHSTLKQRVESGEVSRATAFNSVEEMSGIVASALQLAQPLINSWLTSPSSPILEIKHQVAGNKNIGYGYFSDGPAGVTQIGSDLNWAVIVLRRLTGGDYYIVTAYPTHDPNINP